jgi:hypothetical protein
LEELLSAVRRGRSASLVLTGPAGFGKSWLCKRASERADGFTVAQTCGLSSETHLGYCGLLDVLSPLLGDHLPRLPPARRNALRAALRFDDATAMDRFAVALGTMDLLALAAEDAPVLVVVDDAPSVDAASLEALRFAARRLDADRIGFLFAARAERTVPFPGLETLSVGRLDTSEAIALVNEFALVAEPVARALAAAGGGDPLWLREAARDLTPEQRAGTAPLTDRFRTPASVQEGFARLARELPARARTALVVLAVGESAPAPILDRALGELGLSPTLLEPGIACGLRNANTGARASPTRSPAPRRCRPLGCGSAASPMRRSRASGNGRATRNEPRGTSPRPATARTPACPPRCRTSPARPAAAARRVPPPRPGDVPSNARRTPRGRFRCASSARETSLRPAARPRRSPSSTRSSTPRARLTCARRARSSTGSC